MHVHFDFHFFVDSFPENICVLFDSVYVYVLVSNEVPILCVGFFCVYVNIFCTCFLFVCMYMCMCACIFLCVLVFLFLGMNIYFCVLLCMEICELYMSDHLVRHSQACT